MRVKMPYILPRIAASVLLILSFQAIAQQPDINTLSFTASNFTGYSPYNVSVVSMGILPGFTSDPILNNLYYIYTEEGNSGIVSLPVSFVSPANPQTPTNGSLSPQLLLTLPPDGPFLSTGETSVASASGGSGSTNDPDMGSIGTLVYTPPHTSALNVTSLINS